MSSEPPELPTMPERPIPPPAFGEKPGGAKKPKSKSMQPTYLGTGSTPNVTQLGSKTLLGQ